MISINPVRTEKLAASLLTIWKLSVKASHFFLTEKEIDELIPFVKSAIAQINVLVVIYANDEPVGFMGIEDRKLEMLFISPDYFGKGLGRKLTELAFESFAVESVDVNEQNPNAVRFYTRIGFVVFDRSEYDSQGNPFPILKMRLQ